MKAVIDMKDEQYKDYKCKIDQFEYKNHILDCLKADKIKIATRVDYMDVENEYGDSHTLRFNYEYDGFQERLSSAIKSFFDSEIERIEKDIKEI